MTRKHHTLAWSSFLVVQVFQFAACAVGDGRSSDPSAVTTAANGKALTTGSLSDTCVQERSGLLQRQDALVRGLDRSGCTVDADCVLVETSVPCQELCPVAVPASKRAIALQLLSAFSAAECLSAPAGCPFIPQCFKTDEVRCVQNACLVVHGTGGLMR